MTPSPDVYDAARRKRALRNELARRERDGWMVMDRQPFEATLMHEVRPPWYLAAAELLLGILGGGGTGWSRRRHLHLEAFEDGRLFRATIGDIPPHWPHRAWEVPDGWVSPDATRG